MIDIHADRLWPAPMVVWLDNHGWPGQTTFQVGRTVRPYSLLYGLIQYITMLLLLL